MLYNWLKADSCAKVVIYCKCVLDMHYEEEKGSKILQVEYLSFTCFDLQVFFMEDGRMADHHKAVEMGIQVLIF